MYQRLNRGTTGQKNGGKQNSHQSKKSDATEAGNTARTQSEAFFEQHGVDTNEGATTKQGLKDRSPAEEGTKKKQSFFRSETSSSATKKPVMGASTGPRTSNWREQVKIASANFRQQVQKEEEEERKEEEEQKKMKQQIQKKLRRKSDERRREIQAIMNNDNSEQSENGSQGESGQEYSDSEEDDKIIGDPGRTNYYGEKDLVNTDDKEMEHKEENHSEAEEEEVPTSEERRKKDDEMSKESDENKSKNHHTDQDKGKEEDTGRQDKEKRISSEQERRKKGINNEAEESLADTQEVATTSTPPRFKSVNANSRNRRKCIRVQQMNQGDTTPESNNRTIHVHKYETRVTWKLAITASEEPIKKVKEVVLEFLKELSQIGPKIALLPWHQTSTVPCIFANGQIPSTVTGTHIFLHKLYMPKAGKDITIYPQVRLGHDVDFQTVQEKITA